MSLASRGKKTTPFIREKTENEILKRNRWQSYARNAQEHVRLVDGAAKADSPSEGITNTASALWKQPTGQYTPGGKKCSVAEAPGQSIRKAAFQSRGEENLAGREAKNNAASLADAASCKGFSKESAHSYCHDKSLEEHDATTGNVKSRWACRAVNSQLPCRVRKRRSSSPSCSSIESIPESLSSLSDTEGDAISELDSIGSPESQTRPGNSNGHSISDPKPNIQTVGKRLCKKANLS